MSDAVELGKRAMRCRSFQWKAGMIRITPEAIHVDHPANLDPAIGMIKASLGDRCNRLILDWSGDEQGWYVCAWNSNGDLLIPEYDNSAWHPSLTRAVFAALVAVDTGYNSCSCSESGNKK